MSQHVFVVMEGEICAYQFAYIPHAVFTDRASAEAYAADLIRTNQGQRWPNCAVIEFELNRIGHIEPKVETQ